MPRIPLHFLIADKAIKLLEQGTHRHNYQERLDNGTITQVQSEMKTFSLPGEIFIASADIYQDLQPNAIKLIIRIQQDLEMNNPLWYCPDKERRQVRAALAQLKRKDIIEPIDGTEIFIVNPAKIRKGRPLAVYGALYTYAKKMYLKDKRWKPSTEDIRHLITPRAVDVQDLLLES